MCDSPLRRTNELPIDGLCDVNRRVLYVQHAAPLGGSALSLLYTCIEIRDLGWDPIIVLARPTRAMRELYAAHDLPVIDAPGIGIFTHVTGEHATLRSPASCWALVRQLRQWQRAKAATLDVVARLDPAIVHLNSIVLQPSAQALREHMIPHVWHVRESPPHGGWRTRFIGQEVRRHESVIFLSAFDQRAWTGSSHGYIVENFVPRRMLGPAPDKQDARRVLELPSDAHVVLYVGGTTPIKGFDVLVRSLPLVRRAVPDVIAAMPASGSDLSNRRRARLARRLLRFVAVETRAQHILTTLKRLDLERSVRLCPFDLAIDCWLAACDVLAVPSIAPCFSRPIIEAGAVGRPVIASDIGGPRALVEDGVTGLLVPPGDPHALADAVIRILGEPELAARMGQAGRQAATIRFNGRTNATAIAAIYDRTLDTHRNGYPRRTDRQGE